MWETALAFTIWGSYGSVLTAAHIDPALTAIARSAGLGILLTCASVVIASVRGPREITAAIPWRRPGPEPNSVPDRTQRP